MKAQMKRNVSPETVKTGYKMTNRAEYDRARLNRGNLAI
jgi:hypothetical protein